ncbi:MAG: CpaF family protein [Myxococcota bacterium]
MALRDRLRSDVPEAPKALEKSPRRPRGDEPGPETAYQELKSRVHNRLFELIDLARLGKASEERVRQDVALATRRILEEQRVLFTLEERERVVKEIQDEVFGLGPLEPLLADPTVSDILVNGHAMIYVERMGRLERTVARFKDDLHLMRIIEKIVSSVGRRVDELNPMVDARLADGSRVNAIIPPLALDGPLLSIRRFPADPLGAEDLVELGTITPAIVELFRGVIGSRLNVLVSGGTGAGKTTMLNVLSSFINPNERIITIEDSAELQMHQAHVGRLETRPASIEGKGEVTQRQLVINALRMRPDRIILGEVRGSEAFDMLQAMNTGHDGSLTTIHANSPRDALSRIENMVAMTGLDIPQRAIRSQISSAIHVVVQLARLADGRRRLVSLCEITGLEGDMISMQEIFTLEKRGLDSDGVLQAEIVSTGIRPHFADQLRASGVELPPEMFERPPRESW